MGELDKKAYKVLVNFLKCWPFTQQLLSPSTEAGT